MADEADGVRVGGEPVRGMRLRCICRGHEGTIGRIAWSPCGRFIASPSADKTVRIWDAHQGGCLAVLQGHQRGVVSATWSPDGTQLASFDSVYPNKTANSVRIWTVEDWTQVHVFRNIRGVSCGAWYDSNKRFITGAFSGDLRIWNTNNWALFRTIKPLTDWDIWDLQWSPDKKAIMFHFAEQNRPIRIVDPVNFTDIWSLGEVESCAQARWSSDGTMIVAAFGNSVIIFYDTGQITTFEGHTERVLSICFSDDGRLIASKSADDSVSIWGTDDGAQLATVKETCNPRFKRFIALERRIPSGISFHSQTSVLATLGSLDRVIRIWDIDVEALRRTKPRSKSVLYESAKIVLVGESNVGKSCLAMRLVEDRYPNDEEHGTTHGMRFWPMEAKTLHSSASPRAGQRRDVVLWDFGGQEEYQLVHQMFLHDTTLALLLIDPTRGGKALEEARDWNKRLEKHLGQGRAVKLLIGAQVDRDEQSNLINRAAITSLCEECGFRGFHETSAFTGRGIDEFRKAIADALDWDKLAKTSRPELFQRIRDDVEKRRKRREVVLLLRNFKRAIKRSSPNLYEEAAVEAVSDQLATQGVIVRTRLSGGDEALVLQLPAIERYAGSLIVAARNNPRGVPVLEERLLGSARAIPLPGMRKEERLRGGKERIVLECVVELMIHHGLCFRHGGLLVFPTLFPTGSGEAQQLPHSVSLYYDFTGAIDNIYASLVARLTVGQEFGDGRLWAGRVEFDRPGQGVCGIRQIKRTGGLAHVDLFFAEETAEDRRDLFTRFVEEHLRLNGVEIREHQAIKCQCGEEIPERVVHANIARGEKDVVCPVCRTKTLVSQGVAKIRERDPRTDHRIFALRRKIEEKTIEDAAAAKNVVSRGDLMRRSTEPIRILHISDLHFNSETSPRTHLVPLLQDIRNGEHLGFSSLEYLVISGDMTDRGGDGGFERAREFVESLIDELGLSAQRCILVPGNHDVQDSKACYRWENSIGGYSKDQWIKQGDIYLVRDDDEYPRRFQKFSDSFFHKVTKGEPYPLDPKEQARSYLFTDTRIQFLTLNSAWQIDQFNRKRSGIHFDAVSGVVALAEREIAKGVDRGDLMKDQSVLRIAVWHHAVAGPEMMQRIDFIGNLQQAGVKLCLHGDVHEMRCELIGYKTGKEMQVVGAGSFGSPAEGRPESTPRLYNILEIQPALSSIRVHTRERRKAEGAWSGWYEWPDPGGGAGRVPYFDITLA